MREQFVPTVAQPIHQHKGVYLPLRGPWIITSQNDETYRGLSWKDAQFVASRDGKLFNTLSVSWGQVAYQADESGGVEIAAYNTDSSD